MKSALRPLVAANLIAAIGGGALIEAAMGALKNEPWLQGDSVLAWLLGGTLSLFILVVHPRARRATAIPYFAVGAAVTSLLLWTMLPASGAIARGWPAIAFFSMLCARFTFWFSGRISRADVGADGAQSISWVEMSYYAGISIGLLGREGLAASIPLSTLLLVDIGIQATALLLDREAVRRAPVLPAPAVVIGTKRKFDWRPYVALSVPVVVLTLGTQNIEMVLATALKRTGDSVVSPAGLMAAGYAGAILAAFFCATCRVTLNDDYQLSIARSDGKTWSLSFITVSAWGLLPVVGAVMALDYPEVARYTTLPAVLLSAIFYEVAVLPLLDKLGAVAKSQGRPGAVSMTYGGMALTGLLGVFVMIQLSNSAWILTLIPAACLFLANVALRAERLCLSPEASQSSGAVSSPSSASR